MRILVINPNTTEAVTERLARHLAPLAGPDVELIPVTGRFGARYIASRAAAAIAAHAALDALAEHVGGCDAVYLACFGDPGLLALKDVSPVPVIGMAEASSHLACTLGRRFSIVTGGAGWRPMLQEFVASLGLVERLASIRTVVPSGGEMASDPETAVSFLREQALRCVATDGADVVVIGGAALAGVAARISPQVPIRVLCGVEAGLRATIAVAGLKTTMMPAQPISSETVGLAPPLARLVTA